jgi:hypothetical protein
MILIILVCVWVVQAPLDTPSGDLQELGDQRLLKEEELEVHGFSCSDSNRKVADTVGERLAKEIAALGERRISVMAEVSMSQKEIARERLMVANSWMDAYCFNMTENKHLRRARQQIIEAETVKRNSEDYLRTLLDNASIRLMKLSDLQDDYTEAAVDVGAKDPLPKPKNSLPPKKASVASVQPPRREGRLSLRLEGGYGRWEDDDGDKTWKTMDTGYLNVSLHGRFPFKKLAILLGPYFAWFGASYGASRAGAFDSGGRVEFEMYFSERSRRIVALHPFLEAGLGRVLATGTDFHIRDTAGIAAGPGLALCFVHSVICPTFRIKLTPDSDRRLDTSLQFGLAISIRRFIGK